MATLKTKILHRNDTTANWTSNNPILSKGEFGIEWVTSGTSSVEGSCKIKIGDGFTAWSDLNYVGGETIKIVTSGSGNTVTGISSATDTNGIVTYTLTLGNRLTGSGLTADTILLGNGSYAVKTSSKKIVTTLGADDTTIPTSKAVQDAIGNLNTGVTSVSVDDDDVVVLSTDKNTGAVTISGSHATQGPSTTSNTTKGPSAGLTINGTTTSGSIVVPKVTVNKYGHVTALSEQTISITLPGLEKSTATGSGNVITDFTVSGHTITPTKGISVYTKTEVDNAIAAATNAAVVMRGTLGTNGTITSLPTASSTTLGDAYKVITAGTYASTAAKVGDVFICYTTDDKNYSWMLVPSGDDIEDTWRDVYLDSTQKLGTGTSTGALKLLNTTTSGISVTYDGGFKFDVKTGYTTSGKNYKVQKDTSGNLYVNVPWTDNNDNDRDPGYGKITPANSTAVTALTGNTTQITAGTYNENVKFSAANKWIVLAGSASSTNGSDEMKWGHALSGVTAGSIGPSADVTQTAGNEASMSVPVITFDAAGHITGVATKTFKVIDTTYGIVSNSANGLAPKMTTNNAFLTRVGSATNPTWNSLTVLDGGSASTTDWGTITA